MVRMKMGWLGLLALLPCIFAFKAPRGFREDAVRESEPEERCQFVMQCETALFGFNDKTIRGISVEACKQACLEEMEFDCLSVDYVRDSESCYLSQENAFSQKPHMGAHSGSDHYSYLCGEEELSSVLIEVPDSNCGFIKQCHTALFGFNTQNHEGISVKECMEQCLMEDDFECLSFDYATEKQICYLSEESAETQGAHMGPHFGADYYHKICRPEGSGNNMY